MSVNDAIRNAETQIGYGVVVVIGLGLLSVPLSNELGALIGLILLSVLLVALYLFYRLVLAVEFLAYER